MCAEATHLLHFLAVCQSKIHAMLMGSRSSLTCEVFTSKSWKQITNRTNNFTATTVIWSRLHSGHPKHPKNLHSVSNYYRSQDGVTSTESWFPTSRPHLQISVRSLHHGSSPCDCAATWILCSDSSAGEEGQVREDSSSGKNRTLFLRWVCHPTVGRRYDLTWSDYS